MDPIVSCAEQILSQSDHPALRLELRDNLGLLLGEHLGQNLVDVEPRRDGPGGPLVVACQHDDAYAVGVELVDGVRRGFLDGIGDA